MEQIKAAIESFVKGGDNNDIKLLDSVLHPSFQNIQNGFFENEGIFVFSKEQYIELVNTKKFGGSARSIDYVSIEQMVDNIAIAKVVLESQYLKFLSLIICVRNNEQWQIINNTPKIEIKKTIKKTMDR